MDPNYDINPAIHVLFPAALWTRAGDDPDANTPADVTITTGAGQTVAA